MRPENIDDDNMAITATTVSTVMNCHSEAVNIETERKLTAKKLEILSKTPGLKVIDEPQNKGIRCQDAFCRDEVL